MRGPSPYIKRPNAGTLSLPGLGGDLSVLFLGPGLTKGTVVFPLGTAGKDDMSQARLSGRDLVPRNILVDLWPQVVCSPDLGPALPPHN